MLITNGELDIVDDGVEFVIKKDRAVMEKYVISYTIPLHILTYAAIQHERVVHQTTWFCKFPFPRTIDALELMYCFLQSGLTEKCLASPFTLDVVRDSVLHYIKSWIPDQRVGVLAGNSVHADRAFLAREMPELVDWLHYRCLHSSARSSAPVPKT